MQPNFLDDTNYNSESSQKYFKNSDKPQRKAFFPCGGVKCAIG